MNGTMMSENIQAEIQTLVNDNQVVLFMKGNKDFPQCGFSSRVSQILTYMGVDYKDVNVLESDAMRQGVKDFTNWPTVPQVYVGGEFIGGCDILTEMTLSGELDGVLDAKGVAYDKAKAEQIRESNA